MPTPHAFWRQFYPQRHIGQELQQCIRNDARFFTMGSCFANELRADLMRRGRTVLPAIDPNLHPLFDARAKETSSWGDWDERVQLQFYNTFSIRQEFEKAFGLWAQGPDDFWVVRPVGQAPFWQDPYRRRVFAPSLAAVREITQTLDRHLREAIHLADVFVFTLGLTEVWRKIDNQKVTCAEPGYCGGGGQETSVFHASNYEENLENMRFVIDLLKKHRPDAKIFITVSPVSLGRTFRPGMDVAVANMASKSILRAVVAELTTRYPDIHYFPSYEMCLYDWDRSFREDGRHVQPEKVREIMDQFSDIWMENNVRAVSDVTQAMLEKERAVVDWMEANLRLGNDQANQLVKAWISGYREVVAGRPCPDQAYYAMRQLHVAARGQIDGLIQKIIASVFPAAPLSPLHSELLGTWDISQQRSLISQLQQEGLAILPMRLDAAWVEKLRHAILTQPMTVNGTGTKRLWSEHPKGSARLLVEENALLGLDPVQQLLMDPVVVALVGQYLGCQPVFDLAASFLSFPVDATEADRSRSAQQYHFDHDRISFIKLFCYLTDVDMDAGPHVFVAGSKHRRPDALWRDGRLGDTEVEAAYPENAIRKICAPAGTIFLADTASLHKGLPPKSRERMIFQLEYACSLFGRHYPVNLRREDLGPRAVNTPPRLLLRFR